MKKKPILPLLASMAMPMVLSMLVNSLYNIVDSFFVAKISEQAMTALSLVFPVQNFINAIVEYCTPDEITSCSFVNIPRNTGINGIQITVKIIPWIILKSIPWVAAIFAFLIFFATS